MMAETILYWALGFCLLLWIGGSILSVLDWLRDRRWRKSREFIIYSDGKNHDAER